MTEAAWANVYERDSSDDGATPPLTPRQSVATLCYEHLSEEDEDDYSFSDSETSDDSGQEDDLLEHHNADIGEGQPVPLTSRRQSHKKRHAVRAATTLKGAILALDRQPDLDFNKWSQLMRSGTKNATNYQEQYEPIKESTLASTLGGRAAVTKLEPAPVLHPTPCPAPCDEHIKTNPDGTPCIPTQRRTYVQPCPDSVWNQRFQELVSLPDSDTKFHKLGCLAHDFEHAAETYGKIIISERFMPVAEKTIKPIDLGGIAGGDKFITRGILFKFAVDTQLAGGMWMYGNDVPMDGCAMKAAGHEIRALQRVVDSGSAIAEGVAVPLVTLVDYNGFRLIAVSLLPVSKHTICYGSHDGGKTVHATHASFNLQFETIFRRLNLKPHRVGNHQIRGPGDIEGHWGEDGKLYLLDFGRLYPPESPLSAAQIFPRVAHERAVFFKMLRPELVGAYEVPLCSDAFTAWLRNDPNASQHNNEVHAATEKLLMKVIPDLAAELNLLSLRDRERYLDLHDVHKGNIRVMLKPNGAGSKLKYTAITTGTDVNTLNKRLLHVLHLMHSRGVNMRYLGELRRRLAQYKKHDDSIYKGLLFTEMAARVCKNIIRRLLRGKMRELRPYKQLVLCLFNLFSGHGSTSHNFWTAEEGQLEGTLEYYIHKASQEILSKPQPMPVQPPAPFGTSPQSQGVVPRLSVQRVTPELVISPAATAKTVIAKTTNASEDASSSTTASSALLSPRSRAARGQAVPPPPKTKIRGYTMQRIFKDRPSINVEYEKLYNLDKVFAKKLLPIKSCIRGKFGNNALDQSEWTSTTRGKPFLFQGLFFRRLCDMLGIQLADDPKIYDILNGDPPPAVPSPFKFMEPHVVDMRARKKPMHLVASSEGFALHMKGMDIYAQVKSIVDQGMERNMEKRRKMDNVMTVMRFAKEKLEEAILQVPDSYNTLVYLAKTEHWLALEGHAHLAAMARSNQTAGRTTGEMTTAATGPATPNNVVQQHEYYHSAVKHLEQALEISQMRERAQMSRAKPGLGGTTASSADVSLLLAQVLCDWSVSEAAQLKDTIRAEKQDSLWMRAWNEYKNVVKLSDWATTKEQFLGDINGVINNKVGVDSATTETAEDVGQLVMAIMKIEIMIELQQRPSSGGLEALLGPPPPSISASTASTAATSMLSSSSSSSISSSSSSSTSLPPSAAAKSMLSGDTGGWKLPERRPSSVTPTSNIGADRVSNLPAPHLPTTTPTITIAAAAAATTGALLLGVPGGRAQGQPAGPPSRRMVQHQVVSEVSTSGFTLLPAYASVSATSGMLPPALVRSSEELAQAGLRLSRRRSSDATRMELWPRQQLRDYGASPPVSRRYQLSRAPGGDAAPGRKGQGQQAPATPQSRTAGQLVSSYSVDGLIRRKAPQQTAADRPIQVAVSTPQPGGGGGSLAATGPAATTGPATFELKLRANPEVVRRVATLELIGRKRVEKAIGDSQLSDTPPKPEETTGVERVLREEVCLMAHDGRYLCVSVLDGSISMEPSLQTSSCFVLEYVTDILREGARGAGEKGPHGGDQPSQATLRGVKKLLGIRVAYSGTYLCTDENGHLSAENIILRKNHFRRFGRWEFVEDDPQQRERDNKEDRKSRKRANLWMGLPLAGPAPAQAAVESPGSECQVTIRHTSGAFLRCKKNTGELINSKKQPARVWTVRSLPNKIFLRAAGDGRSHLYCGTTGQVGVTTSNPKEPNTWFLHLLPRTAPVPPPTTPRARAMMDSESEQQSKRKQADGGSLKKAKPHVHYVALQCYMGSYLGLDEGGNVTATLARPFRWKLEEIAHSDDDDPAAPELGSSTTGEGGGEASRVKPTTTTAAPTRAKAPASTGGSGGGGSDSGGGGRFFTLCAKLPKDEGKKYWLCCDNGKLTLVVTPTGATFLRAFALGPKFLMWLVWPYDAKWTGLLSRLYAQLAALHSQRAALALSSGIFKSETKLKD